MHPTPHVGCPGGFVGERWRSPCCAHRLDPCLILEDCSHPAAAEAEQITGQEQLSVSSHHIREPSHPPALSRAGRAGQCVREQKGRTGMWDVPEPVHTIIPSPPSHPHHSILTIPSPPIPTTQSLLSCPHYPIPPIVLSPPSLPGESQLSRTQGATLSFQTFTLLLPNLRLTQGTQGTEDTQFSCPFPPHLVSPESLG